MLIAPFRRSFLARSSLSAAALLLTAAIFLDPLGAAVGLLAAAGLALDDLGMLLADAVVLRAIFILIVVQRAVLGRLRVAVSRVAPLVGRQGRGGMARPAVPVVP